MTNWWVLIIWAASFDRHHHSCVICLISFGFFKFFEKKTNWISAFKHLFRSILFYKTFPLWRSSAPRTAPRATCSWRTWCTAAAPPASSNAPPNITCTHVRRDFMTESDLEGTRITGPRARASAGARTVTGATWWTRPSCMARGRTAPAVWQSGPGHSYSESNDDNDDDDDDDCM